MPEVRQQMVPLTRPVRAVAGDLGFYYEGKNEIGTGWAFGVALTNLGSKISYTDNADQKDYIPANLGFGTTYTKVFNEQNKISFGVDVNKLLVPTPPADGNQVSFGRISQAKCGEQLVQFV